MSQLYIETLPEGIQARFALFEGKKLIAQFVRYNEAMAYKIQRERAN